VLLEMVVAWEKIIACSRAGVKVQQDRICFLLTESLTEIYEQIIGWQPS